MIDLLALAMPALLTARRRDGRVFLNPGAGKRRTGIASSPWAAQEGQDFLANHVVPSIDLVTTHIWADNWMGCASRMHCHLGWHALRLGLAWLTLKSKLPCLLDACMLCHLGWHA